MPNDDQNEITFVYEDADEVHTIAATGAHGGPTPDGASVVANLLRRAREHPPPREPPDRRDGTGRPQ